MLHGIGRTLALRDRTLFIPNAPGGAQALIAGFRQERRAPILLERGSDLPDFDAALFITDPSMEARLDEKIPGWRTDQRITHISDGAALATFWSFCHFAMSELGVPLT